MNYFYLLNNKDIYGINGRFFGPTLSVCDCVDYFKQIGVPEGTSMDIDVGGFNGCYEYINNTLLYRGVSCGALIQPSPSEPEIVPCNYIMSYHLSWCKCPNNNSRIIYRTTQPGPASPQCYRIEMQSQSRNLYLPDSFSPPDPNWNVPSYIQGCVTVFPNTSQVSGPIPLGSARTMWMRVRYLCGDPFCCTYGSAPWGPVAFVAVSAQSLGSTCPFLPSC